MGTVANVVFVSLALSFNIINSEETVGGVDSSKYNTNGDIECYYGTTTVSTAFNPTDNGYNWGTVSCPRYSQGCIKRVSCE
jgi:hypothetical protein